MATPQAISIRVAQALERQQKQLDELAARLEALERAVDVLIDAVRELGARAEEKKRRDERS